MLSKDTHFKRTYYNLKGMLPSKKIILENSIYSTKASIGTSGELLFCKGFRTSSQAIKERGLGIFLYFEIQKKKKNSYLFQNLITNLEIPEIKNVLTFHIPKMVI